MSTRMTNATGRLGDGPQVLVAEHIDNNHQNIIENNIPNMPQVLRFHICRNILLTILFHLFSFLSIVCIHMLYWSDIYLGFLNSISYLNSKLTWIASQNILGYIFVNIIITSFQYNKKMVVFINSHGCSIALVPNRCPIYVYCFIFANLLFGFSDGIFCAYTITYWTQMQSVLSSWKFQYIHNVIFTVSVINISSIINIRWKSKFIIATFTCFLILFVSQTTIINEILTTSLPPFIQTIDRFKSLKESQKVIVMTFLLKIIEQTTEMNFFLISFHRFRFLHAIEQNTFLIMGMSQVLASWFPLIIDNFPRRKQVVILFMLYICKFVLVYINILDVNGMLESIFTHTIYMLMISWVFTEALVPPDGRSEEDLFLHSIKLFCSYISVMLHAFLFILNI